MFFFFLLLSQISAQESLYRERISLAGEWTYHLDTSNIIKDSDWLDSTFHTSAIFPGSLTENKIGFPLKEISTKFLNPILEYVGPLWLWKEIEIPDDWDGKEVLLFLERTKATKVWVDGQFIGNFNSLSTSHSYSLGVLSSGKHELTIQVNNDPRLFPIGGSHALSAHTQSNWNGIIGQFYLEALPQLRIDSVKLTPNIKTKTVQVKFRLSGDAGDIEQIDVKLHASAYNTDIPHTVAPIAYTITSNQLDSIHEFILPLGKEAQLWSNYSPVLYRLNISISGDEHFRDEFNTSFGLRAFESDGSQFKINGITTFLRGKNESCIFPLTGYPPMDVDEWRRVFHIAKKYGINHYRFHSYTPPEAAFQAADLEGIYIQTELPNWSNFNMHDTFQLQYQYQEGKSILDAYGNHPSFVMFSLGNEIGGEREVANKLVKSLKVYDNRPLFAYGTNSFYNDPKPGDFDDYWVTMRTGRETSDHRFDIRGSFATTEDISNGILNDIFPSTTRTYSSAISNTKLPIIGHEIGQYQIYPDYRELSHYTGVLKPLNLKIFKERLAAAGMQDQANDFFRASGKLAALLYREEIEMALRTPDFAGYQLLDLQDYPGQGTALVGLLNAFMENKGLISAKEFRQFNNDLVIQLLMDKYVWTSEEVYQADIQLVNYTNYDLEDQKIEWTICDEYNGNLIAKGTLPIKLAKAGGIREIGELTLELNKIAAPAKLIICLKIQNTPYQTSYPMWIYPDQVTQRIPNQLTIAHTMNDTLIKQLANGAKVLLFPSADDLKNKIIKPQFISEFWNWQVFKKGAISAERPISAGTLGILTNPKHPIFKGFPTDLHTNWQWWSITKHAYPFILDNTDSDYRPIVQVIDNIDRNHKLGLIFEFKINKGKLLVCMADLPKISDDPAAKQLYSSILEYMQSKDFEPIKVLNPEKLKEMFEVDY